MNINTIPSAILFDFDDTLIDARPIINKALEATFKEFGISEEIISIKNIDINRSLRDYFYQIFEDNIIEARDTYYKYYTVYSHDLAPLKGSEEVLKFLYHHQVFTAVVSNKNGSKLRSEISDIFTWQKYFVDIVGSGDTAEDKPSALPAKLALKTFNNEDYSNIWFIGDTLVDLETARNLGCKAILYGNHTVDDLNKDLIHYRVKDHNELLKLLKEIYV